MCMVNYEKLNCNKLEFQKKKTWLEYMTLLELVV